MPDPTAKTIEEKAQEFAAERAHADAKSLNDHARLAASTGVLINGGALTALLAFSAKSNYLLNQQKYLLNQQKTMLALGLIFYIAGVLSAIYNIRILTDATYATMCAWDREAQDFEREKIPDFWRQHKFLKEQGDVWFTLSLLFFTLGSTFAGIAVIFF